MYQSAGRHQTGKVFENPLWENVFEKPAQVLFDGMNNYTDHLGNVRLSYSMDHLTGKLKILEENHYYPFGLRHEVYLTGSKLDFSRNPGDGIEPEPGLPPVLDYVTRMEYQYKYQGQERQDELGLNWDSFKWRNYDYATGRFFNIDPLTEKYVDWGPYVFSGNRVVDARELEGLEPHSVHETSDDAAINFAEQYNGLSIRENMEIGTMFYKLTIDGNTYYSYNTPITGTQGNVDPEQANDTPDGAEITGSGHTHGNDANLNLIFDKSGERISDEKAMSIGIENFKIMDGNNIPSPLDKKYTRDYSLKYKEFEADYVVTPSGILQKTTPNKDRRFDITNKNIKVVNKATKSIPSDPNSTIRQNKVSSEKDPEIMPKQGTVNFE